MLPTRTSFSDFNLEITIFLMNKNNLIFSVSNFNFECCAFRTLILLVQDEKQESKIRGDSITEKCLFATRKGQNQFWGGQSTLLLLLRMFFQRVLEAKVLQKVSKKKQNFSHLYCWHFACAKRLFNFQTSVCLYPWWGNGDFVSRY